MYSTARSSSYVCAAERQLIYRMALSIIPEITCNCSWESHEWHNWGPLRHVLVDFLVKSNEIPIFWSEITWKAFGARVPKKGVKNSQVHVPWMGIGAAA